MNPNVSEAFRGFRCTATGDHVDGEATTTGRSDAGAPLDPVYDFDGVTWTRETLAAATSMWDFAALLPFAEGLSVAEGGTPTVEAPTLAAELGVDRLVVKDEGRNPTGTVLDRGMALAVTAAAAADAGLVAHASPGNSGQSAAAYAGLTDLRSYAFVPSRSPFSTKAMTNVHGGEMRVAGGRYPDALEALHSQLKSEWHTLQEFDAPLRHEGIKTVAYELAGQVADIDAVVVPTGTGEVAHGVAKGFAELVELGVLEARPRVVAAQPNGCAPIAAAFETGHDVEAWEHPDTIVGELEIPDPAGGELVLDAVEATDGSVVTADDDASLESAVTAAQETGLEVSPAGGTALAAAAAAEFESDDTVVVVNPDAAAKTPDILRSHLMSKGI